MDAIIEAQDGSCIFHFGDGGRLTELVVDVGPLQARIAVAGGPSRREVIDKCRELRDRLAGEWTWESPEHDVHLRLILADGKGRLQIRCEPQWQSDSIATFALAVDQSGLPTR